MKTTLEKVYQCDHCKKKMRSAGAMSRHEKYCKSNPNNKHICFEYCRHLKMNRRAVGDGYDGPDYIITDMICAAKDIKMYSYKFEKCANFKTPLIQGLVRMPLDCNKFEVMTDDEIINGID